MDSVTDESSPFIIHIFFPPRALAILISTISTSVALIAASAAHIIEGAVIVSIMPIDLSSATSEVPLIPANTCRYTLGITTESIINVSIS